ncbi:MAG TPA: PAS domain S-box protein [Rectinemataceae bacterium]|nr:PAS domain S-box protein [Rectinemataceae bacterium]
MLSMRLQRYLSDLMWLCMAPLLVLALYLAVNHIQVLQAQFDRDAAYRVRNVTTAIDARLQAQIGALQMLAASPLIDDPRRWREFYDSAASYRVYFDGQVILADLSMRMLLNTRSPFGARLPHLPVPKGHAAVKTVLETGKPSVGDSFMGPIAGELLVSAVVPVLRQGSIRYLLLGTIEARQYQALLAQVALPPGWTISLVDSIGGTMASRTSPGPKAGAAPSEADKRFVAKSTLAEWSAILEMPMRYYRAPVVFELAALVVGFLSAAIISVVAGSLFSRRLTRSVASIGAVPPLSLSGPSIREIEEVRERLATLEADKRENMDRYQALVDQASDAFFVHGFDGRFLEVNQRACESLGYTKEELLGMSVPDIELDFDLAAAQAEWAKIEPGRQFTLRGHQRRKDGSAFPVEVRFGCSVWKGQKLFLGLARDISERVEAEERIRGSLLEKEVLIRELYHRTYNNMQLIQAMMVLQLSVHPDTPLSDFVGLMTQKIEVMASVHRRLYEAGDLSRIDLSAYIAELAEFVLKNHVDHGRKVQLRLERKEVQVLIDVAIPVGLVVHELLTNALEHAFSDRETGEIRIAVSRAGSGMIELVVADDGTNPNRAEASTDRTRLGLRLVDSIIEEQLRGSISADHRSGSSYLIRFSDDQYMVRV